MLNLIAKIAFRIFLGLVVLLLGGTLYEQYARWRLEKAVEKGKTFALINDRKIHYLKKGNGNQTVVFVSGMGSNHTIWKDVQDRVSGSAVTISYDRSGLFLSEPNDAAITNESVSDELTKLLENTVCPKPYILVAHSMGGIYIRPFMQNHAKDISGIIFSDAAHPLQMTKSSQALLKEISAPPAWIIRFLVDTGINRILFSFVPMSAEIPIDHPIHVHERNFFYKSYQTLLREVENDDLNFKDAERYNSFGDLPLTVITGTSDIRSASIKNADVRKEYQQLVYKLHDDLLSLSTKSRHVKATKSGHII